MDLRQQFGTNLRRLHHERGISEQLANDAGIDRTYVSQRAVTYEGLK